MKNIFKPVALGAVAAMAVLIPSCESFEETNTNHNSINKDNITPMYVATPAIIRSTLDADMWQRVMNLGVDTYAQYFSNDKYETNICVPNDSYSYNFWNNNWTWIANLNEAIRICKDDPESQNVKQLCRIWRVWVYSRLTDFFGDVPYSQACNVDYNYPKYDEQKDIYYGMVQELAEASAAIDVSATRLCADYDVIFGADWEKWRQLANTLHLRLALRMTEADPAKAKEEAEKAANAPGGMLAEDAKIFRGVSAYTNSVGYNLFYPWPHFWPSRLTMSTSMKKILTGLGGIKPEMKDYYNPDSIPEYVDPRGFIYFNVTSVGTKAGTYRVRKEVDGKKVWVTIADFRGCWRAVQPGLTQAVSSTPYNMNENNSRLGAFFISDDPTPPVDVEPELQKDRDMILVYGSESEFLLAEAALRGYNVPGTAKDHYEKGIRMSMAIYGDLIKASDIEAYLVSPMKNDLGTSVAFDTSEGADLSANRNSRLMKIITQKYLANFPANSYEAWNDYRRLGMPVLDPFVMPSSTNVQQVGGYDYLGSLRRFIYPAMEKTLNPEQNEIAAQRMGGDKTTTRMWWDCRTEVVK